MSKRLSVLALAAALVPTTVLGTVVVRQTVEEMSRAAPIIVRVRVGPSQAAWDEGHRRIWTWTEVRVTEPLKGEAPATFLVKQPGGVVGPVGQAVSGAARFAEGQDCLLFLLPAPDEKGAFLPWALAASKVDFEARPGATVAVRHLEGLAFAERGAGVVRPVDETELLGTREALLERVRRAVRGARVTP